MRWLSSWRGSSFLACRKDVVHMKILVIGIGSIGSRHLHNAARNPNVTKIGVYDLNKKRAELEVQGLRGFAFSNLDDALDWRPDGTIIATTHDTHLEYAERALDKCACVLVEKPICLDPIAGSEFLKLRAQEVNERRLLVVSNMRFHPGVSTLRNHLNDIGEPLMARAWFGSYLPHMRPGTDYTQHYAANAPFGQGLLLDCIHEFDYLAHLLGPVKSVTATTGQSGTLKVVSEDYASIRLTLGQGIIASIQLNYLQDPKQRGCEIIGTRGTLIWTSVGKQPEQIKVRLFRPQQSQTVQLLEPGSQTIDASNKSLELLMEAFINELRGQTTNIASATEGLEAIEAVAACYRSAETDFINSSGDYGDSQK